MIHRPALLLLLPALLLTITGCGSETLSQATKESLHKMVWLNHYMKKFKDNADDAALRSKVEKLLTELEDLHTASKDMPPFEKEERDDVLINYAQPLMKMRALLLSEAARVGQLKNGAKLGMRVQTVITKAIPADDFFLNSEKYKKLVPSTTTPAGGGGMGGMGGMGGP